LVVDHDDQFFCEADFDDICHVFNIKFIKIINKQVEKGFLTKMWNLAFKEAYNDNCDYFFQCGDDIEFLTRDWIDDSIKLLNENNKIGLTGPIDLGRLNINSDYKPGGQRFIQTQAFVSRKHMEIFGFYFPPQIKNWYCDDWMTHVYYPDLFHQIPNFVKNSGGPPRYQIVGSLKPNCPIRKKCFDLVSKHRSILNNYLKNLPPSTSTSPST
jgi:hypothetical protein